MISSKANRDVPEKTSISRSQAEGSKPTRRTKNRPPASALLEFPGNLTVEQVQRVEAKGDVFGVDRRIMLYVLTRSGQELMEWARSEDQDQQDLFIQVVDNTISYKEHLEALLDFANAAIARMIIVGEAA